MSRLARSIPWLIIAGAGLHVVAGVAGVYRSAWGDILTAGVVGSVKGHATREAAVWFVLTGVALAALGELARWSLRETGRLPARLGWALLLTGALVIALIPASGGWLVAAIGALALWASRSTPVTRADRPVPARQVRAASAGAPSRHDTGPAVRTSATPLGADRSAERRGIRPVS